jgi:hypothetical protein
MQATPLVLVSCSVCHQLHEERPPGDAAHPLCARCTPVVRRPLRWDNRPLVR